MNFKPFAQQVKDNFDFMSTKPLYRTNVGLDEIKDIYLASFPVGTNPIYITNTQHDCTCCKSFIRNVGGLVNIVNGQIVTIWDNITTGDAYEQVAQSMRDYVLSKPITSVFYASEKKYGQYQTTQTLPDGSIINWNHFNCEIPNHLFKGDSVGELAGQHTTSASMLTESLSKFTTDAIVTVSNLISDNLLYRGEEHKSAVDNFAKLWNAFKQYPADAKLFGLENFSNPSARFKNTVIGTLVEDISNGVDIEVAVKSFESKVAPANYKRSKSLITQGMIDSAMKTINELGIEPALERRHATIHDMNINDVLWADKSASVKMQGVAALLSTSVAKKKPATDNVTEVSIDSFLTDLVPTAESIEVLVENRHQSNFMNILAPVNPSTSIMKWDNNFTWSYNGNLADSDLTRRVEAAGGRIDGAFRFTHSWNELERNQSLMDLHVFMPGCTVPVSGGGPDVNGRRVGWNNRQDHASGGVQDVDYTTDAPEGYIPVENITFPDISRMPEGVYTCKIHNWAFRSTGGRGRAEIAFAGEKFEYIYPATRNEEWITIAEVTLKNGVFTIDHKVPHEQSSKSIYNISTNQFTKVNSIMLSPNHWCSTVPTGNKHFMFILDGCQTKDTVRGFYNEFLSNDLTPHRKVFEVLASKMQVQPDTEQLAGIAFSSTVPNDLVVKLTDSSSTRMYKIKF